MLSSSVEVPSPGGMSALSGLSAAAARNVVRSSSISGAMYSLEKSPSSGGPDSVAGNKKRRSSLGAKMVAIVGLSQWSRSTQQLNQQGQCAVFIGFMEHESCVTVMKFPTKLIFLFAVCSSISSFHDFWFILIPAVLFLLLQISYHIFQLFHLLFII